MIIEHPPQPSPPRDLPNADSVSRIDGIRHAQSETDAAPAGRIHCARRGPWLQVFSPAGFEINQVDLPVEQLPPALEGLRILHLSDLHLRRYWTAGYDELIRYIGGRRPDLLLITGDYVESKIDSRPALPTLRRLVGGLVEAAGGSAGGSCFGILGNHDSDLIGPLLGRTGVQWIDGRRVLPERGGRQIELIGLPGVDRGDIDPSLLRRFPARTAGVPRVVLSHFPDTINSAGDELDADLFLAGHSHGGQICLPGGRALITHDTLPKSLCQGVIRHGRTWLVVNRGFGFASIPLRLFCPAEVIEIRLVQCERSV